MLIQILFRTLSNSFYKFICINTNDDICHVKQHINKDSFGRVELVNLNQNYNAFWNKGGVKAHYGGQRLLPPILLVEIMCF